MKRFVLFATAAVLVGMLATPARASQPGWSIVPSPNPVVRTGQLQSGSCTSASSCTAVGTYVRASGAGVTLAERWNGTKWRIQRTPNPAGAQVSALNGVACTAPSACMAAGRSITRAGNVVTLAERWDGTKWRIQPTPNPPGARRTFLNAVACTSSSFCTAVGGYVTGSGTQVNLAERWNGKKWRIQPAPNPAGAQFSVLTGVSCTAPSACTAVGLSSQGTLAERWDGTRWRIQPTPNPVEGGGGLLGVACASSSTCTAVGARTDSSGFPVGTLAERWNGTSWRIQPTPNPAGAQFIFLNGVGCSASSACSAVGLNFTSSGPVTVAERWNGTTWRLQRTPSPAGAQDNGLIAVACTASRSCTAFGQSHNSSGTARTLAERWNGTTWRIQPSPNPTGAAQSGLGSISCTAPSACTATGFGGNATLAERWNGGKWRIQPTPNPAGAQGGSLNAVACTATSTCTAVGGTSRGTLAERWNGRKWTIQATPNPTGAQGSFLAAVACTSSSACTATGNSFDSSGTPVGVFAERWNGTKWRIQPIPAPPGAHGGFLSGVACTSSSVCTAVGARTDSSGNPIGTLAERWNGTSWRIQPTPNPAAGAGLSAVSCTSSSACTAVGGSEAGTLAERWDGTAWRIQPTPKLSGAENFFNGVACTGSACTAVGLHLTDSAPFTLAERWDGTTWRIQPTPNPPGAYDIDPPAVACPTFSACMAVGGYTNDGPKVTLAERWNGTGGTGQLARQPSGQVRFGLACARVSRAAPFLRDPMPAWSPTGTSLRTGSAAWLTALPWCRAM